MNLTNSFFARFAELTVIVVTRKRRQTLSVKNAAKKKNVHLTTYAVEVESDENGEIWNPAKTDAETSEHVVF